MENTETKKHCTYFWHATSSLIYSNFLYNIFFFVIVFHGEKKKKEICTE